MNFNLTLIGQMIAFAIFAWFCTKYIWPFIIKALDERKTKIADGLAASEQGQKELLKAKDQYQKLVEEGKKKAQELINRAQKRGDEIIEQSKESAQQEGERLIVTAKMSIEQEREKAKETLRKQVASLVVFGAKKILLREVDTKSHQDLLNELSQKL